MPAAYPTLKVLTVQQPWATLLALGLKQFETRTWKTSHRGPLLIHASKAWGPRNRVAWENAQGHFESRLFQCGYAVREDFVFGRALAMVELVGCEQMGEEELRWVDPIERSLGYWTPGNYAWEIKTLGLGFVQGPVMEFSGQRGLFDAPPEVAKLLLG